MARSSGFLLHLGADARALCRRTWWVFLIGGLAAVIFGVLAITRPVAAWLVLASFFAAAILVDGVFNLVGAVQNLGKDGWWIMLLIGALGAIVGGYALLHPPVSMMVFMYLVALQAITLGVFLLMLGYRLRAAMAREWILYLTGTASVLLGLLVIAAPVMGGLSAIAVIGSWALVTGALKVLFALKVRNLPTGTGDRGALGR